MATKMAVSFVNIFMAKIETTLIQQSETNSTLASNSRPKYQRTRLLFFDIVVKRERFINESILDIITQYKPTETFQLTHFNSCHPLLRTNSSKTTFEDSLVKFKQHLRTRGYPKTVIERSF